MTKYAEHETEYQSFSHETETVLSLAKDQHSQCSEIQKSLEQLLNTEPLKLKSDENSLIAANNNLFLPAPNNERSSYCSSITSESFTMPSLSFYLVTTKIMAIMKTWYIPMIVIYLQQLMKRKVVNMVKR